MCDKDRETNRVSESCAAQPLLVFTHFWSMFILFHVYFSFFNLALAFSFVHYDYTYTIHHHIRSAFLLYCVGVVAFCCFSSLWSNVIKRCTVAYILNVSLIRCIRIICVFSVVHRSQVAVVLEPNPFFFGECFPLSLSFSVPLCVLPKHFSCIFHMF